MPEKNSSQKENPRDKKVLALLATADITGDQLSGLTGAQLSGLTGAQLSWLTGAQLSWLTRAQLSWLTRDQLSGLTGAQLSWLTRDQLSGLTGDQLSWLTGDQLSWLTRAQLSWLTGDQLSWLTGDQEVPKVPALYSAILADIQAEKRTLDQSTFGPDDGPDGESLCKTPMCIAGHTVNLAGDKGYKLAKVMGFAGAALMIHRASRPDAGAPRYDSYPNEWALAYIEERAAEEKESGGAA